MAEIANYGNLRIFSTVFTFPSFHDSIVIRGIEGKYLAEMQNSFLEHKHVDCGIVLIAQCS